jgi:hypothetical protein
MIWSNDLLRLLDELDSEVDNDEILGEWLHFKLEHLWLQEVHVLLDVQVEHLLHLPSEVGAWWLVHFAKQIYLYNQFVNIAFPLVIERKWLVWCEELGWLAGLFADFEFDGVVVFLIEVGCVFAFLDQHLVD